MRNRGDVGTLGLWLAAVLGLSAGCGGGEPPAARALDPDRAAELLINRNWIDVWPQSEQERLHVYRFVPNMGGGVYQDRTLYTGTFELFTFQVGREGDHAVIDMWMPETKQRIHAGFTIESVDGPPPFDLKLTLSPSPRGPSVYYGRTAETGSDELWLPAQP